MDLSIQIQQSALSYHLGVRESFGMKGNILMYNDVLPEQTLRLKVTTLSIERNVFNKQTKSILLQISCGNYTFLPYVLQDCGTICNVTNSTKGKFSEDQPDSKQTLMSRLKKLLQDVEIQSK